MISRRLPEQLAAVTGLEHARTFLAVVCYPNGIYPSYLQLTLFERTLLSFWQPRDPATRTDLFKSIILPVCVRSRVRGRKQHENDDDGRRGFVSLSVARGSPLLLVP